MADDEVADGDPYDEQQRPPAILVSLDEPWQPPAQDPVQTWPSLLPPGALALAAAALALVALAGNSVSASFGYVLKFSLGGNTAAADAAQTALWIQIILAVVAAGCGLAAVVGARSVEDAPRWTRDLAIAAVIVAVVAAGVHITLLQTLNTQHIPADGSFVSN